MAKSVIKKNLASELETASKKANRASNALGTAIRVEKGETKNITFSSYSTAALIYIAITDSIPILYIYSNGYLAPVASNAKVTVTLSSDYKTVTITNNHEVANGILGVICNPPVTFTIT